MAVCVLESVSVVCADFSWHSFGIVPERFMDVVS